MKSIIVEKVYLGVLRLLTRCLDLSELEIWDSSLPDLKQGRPQFWRQRLALWLRNQKDLVFGITSHELFLHRQLYQSRYQEELGGRIKVYDSGSIHRRDVERICNQYNPS